MFPNGQNNLATTEAGNYSIATYPSSLDLGPVSSTKMKGSHVSGPTSDSSTVDLATCQGDETSRESVNRTRQKILQQGIKVFSGTNSTRDVCRNTHLITAEEEPCDSHFAPNTGISTDIVRRNERWQNHKFASKLKNSLGHVHSAPLRGSAVVHPVTVQHPTAFKHSHGLSRATAKTAFNKTAASQPNAKKQGKVMLRRKKETPVARSPQSSHSLDTGKDRKCRSNQVSSTQSDFLAKYQGISREILQHTTNEPMNGFQNSTAVTRATPPCNVKPPADVWYPARGSWPRVEFGNVLQLTDAPLPQVGVSGNTTKILHLIREQCQRIPDSKTLVVPDDEVGYAVWNGRHVKVSSAQSTDLYLGWHRKDQKFLCIKLHFQQRAPSVRQTVRQATTAMFLNRTGSTPRFYGIAYVSDSPTHANIALVDEYVAIDLVPTSLKTFVNNLVQSDSKSPLQSEKSQIANRALRLCIATLDQLQKVHESGAILNVIPPDSVLLKLENKRITPYFTHLSEVSFRTSGPGATDPTVNTQGSCLPPQRSTPLSQGDQTTNIVQKARRACDLLAAGHILYAVGCVTKLHTLRWLGESCIQRRPSMRPGIRSMRIQLVKLLQQTITLGDNKWQLHSKPFPSEPDPLTTQVHTANLGGSQGTPVREAAAHSQVISVTTVQPTPKTLRSTTAKTELTRQGWQNAKVVDGTSESKTITTVPGLIQEKNLGFSTRNCQAAQANDLDTTSTNSENQTPASSDFNQPQIPTIQQITTKPSFLRQKETCRQTNEKVRSLENLLCEVNGLLSMNSQADRCSASWLPDDTGVSSEVSSVDASSWYTVDRTTTATCTDFTGDTTTEVNSGSESDGTLQSFHNFSF